MPVMMFHAYIYACEYMYDTQPIFLIRFTKSSINAVLGLSFYFFHIFFFIPKKNHQLRCKLCGCKRTHFLRHQPFRRSSNKCFGYSNCQPANNCLDLSRVTEMTTACFILTEPQPAVCYDRSVTVCYSSNSSLLHVLHCLIHFLCPLQSQGEIDWTLIQSNFML